MGVSNSRDGDVAWEEKDPRAATIAIAKQELNERACVRVRGCRVVWMMTATDDRPCHTITHKRKLQ